MEEHTLRNQNSQLFYDAVEEETRMRQRPVGTTRAYEALNDETWRDIVHREGALNLRKAASCGQLRSLRRPTTREVVLPSLMDPRRCAVALRDPDAAAAMRHLRGRVRQLDGPSAALPSELAYARINAPRQTPFLGQSSQHHLLTSYSAMLDPSVLQRRRRVFAEPTSLWCESWGACADERHLDLDWRFPTGKKAGPGASLPKKREPSLLVRQSSEGLQTMGSS